jgi:hypothetical protein
VSLKRKLDLLPEKQRHAVGAGECIGSGFCCMKSQCVFSVAIHGTIKGKACPELLWNGERHLCNLMIKGDGRNNPEYYRGSLAEGAGCCSGMNSWRMEPLQDRRHLRTVDEPWSSGAPPVTEGDLQALADIADEIRKNIGG